MWQAQSTTLKVACLLVVESAVLYNAPAAFAALGQLPDGKGVGDVFTLWFQLLPSHKRVFDKKVALLAMLAIVAAPAAQLPPLVAQGLPQVVAKALELHASLTEQKNDLLAAENADSDDDDDDDDDSDDSDEDSDEDSDDSSDDDDEEEEGAAGAAAAGGGAANGAGGDDDDENEGYGTDEDVANEEDEEYMKMLAEEGAKIKAKRQAAAAAGGGGGAGAGGLAHESSGREHV